MIAHINGIENPLLGQALKNNKIILALVLVQKMNLDLNTVFINPYEKSTVKLVSLHSNCFHSSKEFPIPILISHINTTRIIVPSLVH